MRVTQGTFSFLPDLSDRQIKAQVQYCLDHSWAVNIEFTDDPHPRNTFWEMWDLPMFEVRDAAGVMFELNKCRAIYGGTHYIRVTAFDSSHGCESVKLSFIASRPGSELGFVVTRTEGPGRSLVYQTRSYATDEAEGSRYQGMDARI